MELLQRKMKEVKGRFKREIKKYTDFIVKSCQAKDMDANTLLIYLLHFQEEINDFLCADKHTIGTKRLAISHNIVK